MTRTKVKPVETSSSYKTTANSKDLQPGEYVSITSYYQVDSKGERDPSTGEMMAKAHPIGEEGNFVLITPSIIDQCFHSASQYQTELSANQTELARILVEEVGSEVFMCEFIKQNGEHRELVGCVEAVDRYTGRVRAKDLKKVGYCQVDLRTIQWLIHKQIKYTLK